MKVKEESPNYSRGPFDFPEVYVILEHRGQSKTTERTMFFHPPHQGPQKPTKSEETEKVAVPAEVAVPVPAKSFKQVFVEKVVELNRRFNQRRRDDADSTDCE